MKDCVDIVSSSNKTYGNAAFMPTRMGKDTWDFEVCVTDLNE